MPDETDALLRQILETQQELLGAYKEETKHAAEFRKTAVEMQKVGQRRGLIAGLMVIIDGVIILAGTKSGSVQ